MPYASAVPALRAPRAAQGAPWSLAHVLAAQALAGGLVALLAALHSPQAAVSAAWGALSVWLPSALMVRAITRPAPNAAAALLRFFAWELAKLALCVALLCAAPRVVPDLNWLALLAALVAVTKIHWFALLAGRTKNP